MVGGMGGGECMLLDAVVDVYDSNDLYRRVSCDLLLESHLSLLMTEQPSKDWQVGADNGLPDEGAEGVVSGDVG